MNLVIVESPAKAKTINKYLGADYTVLPSYGHVRDLPARDGSVEPENDFAMSWEVDAKAAQRLNEIARAARKADRIILATDPDREGEAISWHVLEVLRQKGVLRQTPVERVVFNAITKAEVQKAMADPRQIDQPLVDAYLARRALDYLVGFTLSPVLWRKLPGSRSAGRVQSVALRLVVDREMEIEAFRPQEYWSIAARFRTPQGAELTARLARLDGRSVDKLSLANKAMADTAIAAIETGRYRVETVEAKPTRRHPAPPFITSTLQQEAARKLGFSAKQTMQVAQRLYEGVDIGGETVGLITYMRTDGMDLAPEALRDLRSAITRDFGERYLPAAPRAYKSKARNAQEAHEAIRPTDPARRPADLRQRLPADMAALYDLIWKRTIACQMQSAELESTTIDIASGDGKIGFRATGSVVKFDGFLVLYQEGRDDDAEEEDGRLPPVAQGDPMARESTDATQHFTQPPPRFSEASLVKKLEELGIGRPSTYASILSVLRDRGYVRMDRNRFIPEDKGRLVTIFLTNFFGRYVDHGFTAELERSLDDVSDGKLSWKQVMRDFWRDFAAAVAGISELRVGQVLEAIDTVLEPHLFPVRADGTDPRVCPSCADGRLSLKLGKFGAFIGCSNYPSCNYTRPLATPDGDAETAAQERVLGQHPETGEEITLKVGRFGPYVQQGKGVDGEKPRRAGIPKGLDPATLELERALQLLALPREVGIHPETGKPILAGLGRFGPYLNHDGAYARLDGLEDVLSVGLNRAVTLLAERKERGGAGRRGPQALRELGTHPETGAPVKVLSGRYGPYVSDGTTNANIPNGQSPEAISLDEAVALLAARAAAGGRAKSGRSPAATKKTAGRKTAASAKKSGPSPAKPKPASPAAAKGASDRKARPAARKRAAAR